MHILVRKLLIFSVFITLFAYQNSFGTERESLKYRGGGGTQTLMIMENVKPSSSARTVISDKPTAPLAQTTPSKAHEKIWGHQKRNWQWWEMPLLFVTSLFEPFIEDAPKVAEVFSNERDKLAKRGAKDYLKDTGKGIAKSLAKTAQADPLEFTLNVITQGGALIMGYSNSDLAGLLPLVMGTATGIKQSQLFFAAAHEIGSRTTVDKICRLGLIAGGVYLIASVPGAYALETLTLGTQYQVTTTTPGGFRCSIAPTSTNGTAFGVWLDPNSYVVGCTLTSSGQGTVFTLSSAASSGSPGIACSTSNPLCIATYQCGTDICVRPFNPFTQALSTITHANNVTSTTIGGGVSTVLSNGDLAMSWASSDPGIYKVWQRTYSGSTGLALTSPLVVNTNQAVIQGENCIVGLPGSPPTVLMGWSGGKSPSYIINSAIINAATGTVQTTASTVATDTLPLQDIACFMSNGEGRLAWSASASSVQILRMSLSGSPIGSPYSPSGATGSIPVGVGTPDGNAFIAVQQQAGSFVAGYGGTFASDALGTPQSSFIQIPFNPNNNGQQPMCLTLLGGGTSTSYDVLALFDGAPSLPVYSMQARNIHISAGGTSSPTTSPAPTTTSPAPTTTSPVPTTTSPVPTTTSPVPTTTSPAPTTTSQPPATPTPSVAPTNATSSASSLKPPFLIVFPAQLLSSVFGAIKDFWQ